MANNVVMPQMGESIAEGTIVRWMKKVGDTVERDEPLFEISTDKVDAEIPSPVAGVLLEIRAREGQTVDVNSVVAVIGDATGAAAEAAPETPGHATPGATAGRQETAASAAKDEPAASHEPREAHQEPSDTDPVRQRLSPLVRRIAQEHNVDVSRIRGTGISGRVTKNDILAYLSGAPAPDAAKATPAPAPQAPRAALPSLAGQVVPMSVMRRKVAEHMMASRRTSAHVHSVFEVNFTKVEAARLARKDEFERAGAKLSYLPFILRAVVEALRAVPVINASVDGDDIVYHRDVNIGIAVALEAGLIVPVIKHADELNLLGLSRSLNDLAGRARGKRLKPEEVADGTFTITNFGVSGSLFGMPIINQPQVAILGVGAVEKRAVVIDDAIAIRPMAYMVLGFDHRIIDGAVGDEFLAHVKRTIEGWRSEQD